jgi:hypothetical protein
VKMPLIDMKALGEALRKSNQVPKRGAEMENSLPKLHIERRRDIKFSSWRRLLTARGQPLPRNESLSQECFLSHYSCNATRPFATSSRNGTGSPSGPV